MADYKVQVGEAGPIMVRAANRAQAIRFATHKIVQVEILTTEDAIKLAKAGQELLDATGEPEVPEADLEGTLGLPGDEDRKEPDTKE